jgi:hypothetical protein
MVNLHSCAPPSASQIRRRALRHPRVALLSAYLLALKYAKPIHIRAPVWTICAASRTLSMPPSAHDLRARIRAALLLDLPVFWFPPRQFAIRLWGARARKKTRVCKNMRRFFSLGTRRIAQFRRHAKMGLTVLQFGGLAACASRSANIYARKGCVFWQLAGEKLCICLQNYSESDKPVYVCVCILFASQQDKF